jgi:hypothetical protein
LPPYTGKFQDGFGNHITVWTVSNPVISNHEPAELYDRAPGFGIVRLDKKGQTITMECWPRWVDPSEGDDAQFPGWPLTISVSENYDRKAIAFLPVLTFEGIEYPVVQVINEKNGEIIYTRRITEQSFRPKVFSKGAYTIQIGEPGTDRTKTLEGIQSETLENGSSIVISF